MNSRRSVLFTLILVAVSSPSVRVANAADEPAPAFAFPDGYLDEPTDIPEFWVSSVADVNSFLRTRIQRGQVKTIGQTAGGRPIPAVFYGKAPAAPARFPARRDSATRVSTAVRITTPPSL